MLIPELLRAARRSYLNLRVDGFVATIRRAWTHLFGTEHRYVFVQYMKPPSGQTALPVETNGIMVRRMTPHDLKDVRVRRHEPQEADRLTLGVVATRQGQIVGAAWYTDSVTPAQPWYPIVEPHLHPPAWFDANIFVVPGDKGAGWAISKNVTDAVALAGVRSTVALVGVDNKPSIFLLRLLGAKLVGRLSVRHRLGYTTTVVAPVTQDKDSAL
jgi:hypothetical protein